jgi:nucleolar pre-ribosomal-associated protein 1
MVNRSAVLTSTFQLLDFTEKAQMLYTINMLRRLPDATSNQTPRLPTYTTLFFAHALRAIYDPAAFTYPLISKFLLQRPEFDQRDVPMFYATLFSASDDWKKERGWILRYLANGMLSTTDWRVLKRRHVWDLLATMYQSSRNDKGLCTSILKVSLCPRVFAMTC